MHYSKNRFSRFIVYISIALCTTSCVWRHVTPSHNTPNFTGRNQLEVALATSLTGFGLNAAYSPIKYIAVDLNSCSSLSYVLPQHSAEEKVFNYQAEVGLTAYLPIKKAILGLSGGYGIGSTNWIRWWYASESSAEPFHGRFDTKRNYFNPYFIYNHSENLYTGVSIKFNLFKDHYIKTSSDSENFPKYNYDMELKGAEIIWLLRRKISKKIWMSFDLGLALSDYAGIQHETVGTGFFIANLGFVYKIPAAPVKP